MTDPPILQVVADVLSFLRDLPINVLLSVSDLDQMSAAVMAIFQHMNKLKASKYYDLERAGKLLESMSRALAQQVSKRREWQVKRFPITPITISTSSKTPSSDQSCRGVTSADAP